MKSAIIALCLGSAAAFVPSSHMNAARSETPVEAARGGSTAGGRDFTSEVGCLPPVGFFDPAGFMTKEPGRFEEFREKELKHGRVAMLAVTGYGWVHFIGGLSNTYLSTSEGIKFADVPNSIQALTVIPPFGTAQIILLAAILEIKHLPDIQKMFGYEGGDYGTDKLWYGSRLEGAKLFEKQTKEIQNGRLAMLGAAGLIAQDLVSDGHPYDAVAFSVGNFGK